MSCDEVRLALYSKLTNSHNLTATQILDLLKPALGEPSEMEEMDNGEVLYFSYDKKVDGERNDQERVTTAVFSYETRFWYLRHTLAHDREYMGKLVELPEVISFIYKMEEETFRGIPHEPWFLHVHKWYNGSDEPVPTREVK